MKFLIGLIIVAACIAVYCCLVISRRRPEIDTDQ